MSNEEAEQVAETALQRIRQLEAVARIFKWGTFAAGVVMGILLCKVVS